MSGIYIPGMEMPIGNEPITLFIYPDRKAVVCGRLGPLDNYEAVPVPDHGRLIDADALMQHEVFLSMDGGHLTVVYASYVRHAPTIIPADKEEEG